MPHFHVEYQIIIDSEMTVTADDEEQARDKARKLAYARPFDTLNAYVEIYDAYLEEYAQKQPPD